jgi:cell division septation protein DedD
VPDLTHNDGDSSADGFHEIQLSGKQLVFLFMATTVVAVFIFLCGVLVGRNVRNDRATDSADAMAAMASSAAAPAVQPSGQTAAPAADPPPPAQDADDGLSYAKRLQATNAPPERLKPPSAAPAANTPASAAPAAAVSHQSAPVTAPKTKMPPAAPAPAAKTTAGTGARLAGTWIVQVQALKDRGAAQTIAQHLVSKGYPAFVLDPDSGAPAIYRVQVGRYSDRQEAEQIARRLEKDEQFKPIIHSAR